MIICAELFYYLIGRILPPTLIQPSRSKTIIVYNYFSVKVQSVVGELGKTTEINLNGNRFLLIQISINEDFYKLQLHTGGSCLILKLNIAI